MGRQYEFRVERDHLESFVDRVGCSTSMPVTDPMLMSPGGRY